MLAGIGQADVFTVAWAEAWSFRTFLSRSEIAEWTDCLRAIVRGSSLWRVVEGVSGRRWLTAPTGQPLL